MITLKFIGQTKVIQHFNYEGKNETLNVLETEIGDKTFLYTDGELDNVLPENYAETISKYFDDLIYCLFSFIDLYPWLKESTILLVEPFEDGYIFENDWHERVRVTPDAKPQFITGGR